jgi:hypothetical protein
MNSTLTFITLASFNFATVVAGESGIEHTTDTANKQLWVKDAAAAAPIFDASGIEVEDYSVETKTVAEHRAVVKRLEKEAAEVEAARLAAIEAKNNIDAEEAS